MTALWVLLGGALGAPARHLTDRWVRRRWEHELPLGILTVNVVGSLLLGVLAGAAVSPAVSAAVGTGFCGALTTYSTFSHDTAGLVEVGRWRVATSYVVASLALGLGAVSLGWWLGGLL